MRLYEGLFAFPTNTAPDERKAQEKGVEALVEKLGGKIQGKTDLGKRAFGYEVKKNREGQFVLFLVELDPLKLMEFQRALQLNAGVVKFMITQKDAKKKLKPARKKKKPEKVATAAAG